MPIRRSLLQQPSRSSSRTTRPSLSALLIINQERHPVSNRSKSDSSAPSVKYQGTMPSVTFQEVTEMRKKLQEELALIAPKDPKEYHHINDSLTNPAL
jgi:hypothetical protein